MDKEELYGDILAHYMPEDNADRWKSVCGAWSYATANSNTDPSETPAAGRVNGGRMYDDVKAVNELLGFPRVSYQNVAWLRHVAE